MLLTTTPNVEGQRITKYLGIVNGEAIIGANIVKDFLAVNQQVYHLLCLS